MFLMVFKIAFLLMCFFTLLMVILLGLQTLVFDDDRLFKASNEIFGREKVITLKLIAFVAGCLAGCFAAVLLYAIITN